MPKKKKITEKQVKANSRVLFLQNVIRLLERSIKNDQTDVDRYFRDQVIKLKQELNEIC